MMNDHLEAVARTRPHALLVADMPFLSFHLSPEERIRNAGGFLQRGADAVKLEGGAKRVEMVRALVDCEIPVMGQLSLTPQSVNVMGGFKVQGRRADDALRLLDDAHRLQEAGCFALVLEGIPAELAARMTETLTIPTIGIRAGPACSGQVLVFHDVLGLTAGRRPKFVRAYADGLRLLQDALSRWAAEVRDGLFRDRKSPIGCPRACATQSRNGHLPRDVKLDMQTIRTVTELRHALLEARKADKWVGVVPTMGYLHDATWRSSRRAGPNVTSPSSAPSLTPLSSVQMRISVPIRAISRAMRNCAMMPELRSSLLPMQRKSIRLNLRLL